MTRFVQILLCITTAIIMVSCTTKIPPTEKQTLEAAEIYLTLNKKNIYIGYPPFVLSGGHPEGGIYSGVGVKDGKFYPAVARSGVHAITYSYGGKTVCDKIEVRGPRQKSPNSNCRVCGGTGKIGCERTISCTTCSGKKEILVSKCEACDASGRVRTAWKLWMGRRDCPNCEGRGSIYRRCGDCKGTGREKCPKCKGTGQAECSCFK